MDRLKEAMNHLDKSLGITNNSSLWEELISAKLEIENLKTRVFVLYGVTIVLGLVIGYILAGV
jgi:hypothetical protein